jgi:hypothetical protein
VGVAVPVVFGSPDGVGAAGVGVAEVDGAGVSDDVAEGDDAGVADRVAVAGGEAVAVRVMAGVLASCRSPDDPSPPEQAAARSAATSAPTAARRVNARRRPCVNRIQP